MFAEAIYGERRQHLRGAIESGLILLLGNDLSPMNCAGNPYPFRQDSSFLYFFGLDEPGLAAVIDLEGGTETIFADELTIDHIVWMGDLPTVSERAAGPEPLLVGKEQRARVEPVFLEPVDTIGHGAGCQHGGFRQLRGGHDEWRSLPPQHGRCGSRRRAPR